ncbi:hypothetical protein GCK32_009332 [Trichostrongylus colubriformis]|uniref:Uncharacterized protein n=1 Tax=Trichostrongylus colubriformis TaxID=6319 RepID=A0AAN8FPU4_TRICO
MFLIITVLALIASDTYCEKSTSQKNKSTTFIGQHDENTTSKPKAEKRTITILLSDPDMKETFSSINEKWFQKPIWDYGIALDALVEAVIRNRTEADFKLYRRKQFPKGERNKTTMVEKVEKLLGPVRPSYQGWTFSTLDWMKGNFKAVGGNH